jgi:catechol 2,3-dioxygenase-like lactoylglutathione lyase family enzyme
MADPTYEIRSNDIRDASVAKVDMKLEVVIIPVSDVGRAKEFYKKLGFTMVKYIRAIEFIEDYATIGQGQGGWREDYQYFSQEAGI